LLLLLCTLTHTRPITQVAICGVPGAMTPTCSEKHLPGFIAAVDELKSKGVDTVACISVNDPFVMGAWGKKLECDDKVRRRLVYNKRTRHALFVQHPC
jgi:peroxiredoxin